MSDDHQPFPSFHESHFLEIGGSAEGEYIAFLYDPDEEPVGTLRGNDLIHLMDHLASNARSTGYRYVLLRVIDTYAGETIN